MREELLSVIVPAYNVEAYIEECVKSIQAQTHQNIEIVIINDGSTDKTGAVCEKLALEDSRIKYVCQKNSGVTVARTKGVEIATGEYVMFVDGDDYIDENMLERLLPFMLIYDMVSCGFWQQRANGEVSAVYNYFEGGYSSDIEMKIFWSNMLYDEKTGVFHNLHGSLCGKVFKKSWLLSVMSKMDTEIFWGEDATIVLQYALKCDSVFFLKEPFYYYRFRENSTMNSKNYNILDNVHRIFLLLKSVFDEHDLKNELNYQLQKWVIVLVIQSVNKYLGFEKENRIPQFIVNMDDFVGKKVAIYGAGQMGQDVIWQYNKLGGEAFLWVDRSYMCYKQEGLPVQPIEVLKEKDIMDSLDAIIIAISDEEVVKRVKEDLLQLGIEKTKIVWKKPIQIY